MNYLKKDKGIEANPKKKKFSKSVKKVITKAEISINH